MALPALISVGSFLFMLIFMMLTSPVQTVGYSIVFFVSFAIFIISLGYLFTYLQSGVISGRARYRILIISFLTLIAVMLRSSQSLNLVDAIVLILITVGLLTYSGRRT